MSYKKLLFEFNVVDQKEDINNILQKVGHTLEGEVDHYLGSGYYGDVFKIKGTNKVVKVTWGDKEIRAIKKLVGKSLDNVMEYYFARELPLPERAQKRDKKSLTLIVGEYLDPLPFNRYNKALKNLMTVIEYIGDGKPLTSNSKAYLVDTFEIQEERDKILHEVTEFIKKQKSMLEPHHMGYLYHTLAFSMRKNINNMEMLEFLDDMSRYPTFIRDCVNGLSQLDMNGIRFGDLHTGNVLYSKDDKQFKLIDITI